MGKRILRETRDLLGELLREEAFLVKSVENPDSKAVVQAANIDSIKKALAGQVIGMVDQDPIVADDPVLSMANFSDRLERVSPESLEAAGIDRVSLEKLTEKIGRLPSNYKEAGEAAQALIFDEASKKGVAEIAQWLKENFMNLMGDQKSGAWTPLARRMYGLKSGGAAEVTGAGELSLYVSFLDIDKPKKPDFDLTQSGKNISVKSFTDAGARLGAGSGERERLEKEIDSMQGYSSSEKGSLKLTLKANSVTPDQLSESYLSLFNGDPQKAAQLSKDLSAALFRSMIPNDGKLIGTAAGGWQKLEMEGNNPPIVITLVTANRPKFNLAPGTSLGGYTSKTEWLPATQAAKKVAADKQALAGKTVADLLKGLTGKLDNTKILARTIREIAVDSGVSDDRWRVGGELVDGRKLVDASREYLEQLVTDADRENTEFLDAVYTSRQVSEAHLLLRELLGGSYQKKSLARPSLLTELALYERKGVLSEGIKEKVVDVVQFLIAGAAEYGIAVPTLGTGTPAAVASETVVDAVFAVEGVSSSMKTVDEALAKAGEFSKAFNGALEAKDKIKSGDFQTFYEKVKEVVSLVIETLGSEAKDAADEIAKKMLDAAKKMIDKLSNVIGKALKLVIPDAAIGLAVGEVVQQTLTSLATNCYSTLVGGVREAGELATYITDPDKMPKLLEEAIPKFANFMRECADALDNTSNLEAFMKGAVVALGGGAVAGVALKQMGPTGLRKLAEMLEEKQPMILSTARKITGILVPVIFAIMAVSQVLMKKEYVSVKSDEKVDDKSKEKEGELTPAGIEAAAQGKAVSESRKRKNPVAESRLLLRELGV